MSGRLPLAQSIGGHAEWWRSAANLAWRPSFARLTGTIYVLDEPTIGLHQRDTHASSGHSQAYGIRNTLVVVEHDPDVIKTADHVIDMGPAAGEFGGEIVASGTWQEIASAKSPTGEFLSGERTLHTAAARAPDAQAGDRRGQGTHQQPRGIQHPIPRRCLTA